MRRVRFRLLLPLQQTRRRREGDDLAVGEPSEVPRDDGGLFFTARTAYPHSWMVYFRENRMKIYGSIYGLQLHMVNKWMVYYL